MMDRCLRLRPLARRIALAASILSFAVVPCAARAQAADTSNDGHAASTPVNYSSSLDWKSYLNTDDSIGDALPSSPRPSPQYGQQGARYPESTSRWSHLAIEAGAGFTAPVGNTAHGWETYGYNIKAGAGWNFNKHLGLLVEYQWNRDKIPGSTLTQLAIASGSNVPFGGNVNTWSFTMDPIFYLPPITSSVGVYVTGGGGFYRKVTNFTVPVLSLVCYYYCYEGYYPATIAHSSSNQGGLNIRAGFYWKPSEDGKMKLFAEAGYLWVDSPVASNSDPYGSGTSSLVPVTFGVRF